MTVKQASDVKLIVFACEAGMGSSLIGENQLKRRLKQAGLGVKVIHAPVNRIPAEADVVISHIGLVGRARSVAPHAAVLGFKTFVNNPVLDEIVVALGNGQPIGTED
jgi:mannitol PTS system EIICBA or EIICB component